VSFLVPAERAKTLLDRVLSSTAKPEVPSLALVGRQLRAYQDAYLRDMFDSATTTIALGPFRVVTQPAPFFRCWGDGSRDGDMPYEKVRHSCATDADIYLDEDQTTGSVTISHQLITSRTLNAPRFSALYSNLFGDDNAPSGAEEYVTNWKCETRNVQNGKTSLRAAFCLRRYRKLGALYDGLLKIAVLGKSDVGLVSTLSMTGVTFDNANRLAGRYLKQVTWR